MSIDDVQFEISDWGPESDRRRRPATVVIVVVLVVVLAAGYYADRRSRQGEFVAVSRCARVAADEVSLATGRVRTMSEYVRPALAQASGETIDRLYGMVAHEAGGTGPGLQQARDACAAIEPVAWHSAQRTALTAQLSYLDAQLALLDDTAADGRAYFGDQIGISDLRATPASTLAAALPSIP